MNLQDLKKEVEHRATAGVHTMENAISQIYREAQLWLKEHGKHLHPENHFLLLNPVKIFWSKIDTKVERTADLMLRASSTSTPQAGDKILCRPALKVTVSWPNEREKEVSA